MKFFDFHTHAFPVAIASRTLASLSQIAGITPHGDGTLSAVVQNLNEAGACGANVLNIVTKPGQETTVNRVAAEQDCGVTGQGNTYCFGSVHPDSPHALDELSRIHSLGLVGVKLHPDYQGFFIDDEKLFPLYEKISELGLVVVFHAGYDPLSPKVVHAPPEKSAAVLRTFPKMKTVLAHFGGLAMPEEVEKHLAGRFENLYLDTSCSSGVLEPEQAKRILGLQGTQRVLFGSDFPWRTTAEEVQYIKSLGLSEAEEAAIFYENAARLLGF